MGVCLGVEERGGSYMNEEEMNEEKGALGYIRTVQWQKGRKEGGGRFSEESVVPNTKEVPRIET